MPRPRANPAEYLDEEESSITKMARLGWDVTQLNMKLDSIDKRLEKIDARFDLESGKYVTKDEFLIVRNIVFGMVGLILVGFITGLVALVWGGGR